MSKTRTIQEINNEYFQTAALLGDLVHKVIRFTGDNPFVGGQITELNTKLNGIDKEADFYQKSQDRDQKVKIQKAGDAKITTQMPAQEQTTPQPEAVQ